MTRPNEAQQVRLSIEKKNHLGLYYLCFSLEAGQYQSEHAKFGCCSHDGPWHFQELLNPSSNRDHTRLYNFLKPHAKNEREIARNAELWYSQV